MCVGGVGDGGRCFVRDEETGAFFARGKLGRGGVSLGLYKRPTDDVGSASAISISLRGGREGHRLT